MPGRSNVRTPAGRTRGDSLPKEPARGPRAAPAPPGKGLPDERRNQILDAAAQAMQDRGLAGTRISDIGDLVGMSPGHLMYYFGSKERLLYEAVLRADDISDGLLVSALASVPSARDRLARLIEISFPPPREEASSQWALWLEVDVRAVRDPKFAELGKKLDQRWRRRIRHVVEEGQAAGEFADVDPDDFTMTFAALMDGLATRAVVGPDLQPREAVRLLKSFAAERLWPPAEPPKPARSARR